MGERSVWRVAKHGRPAACAPRLNRIVPAQAGIIVLRFGRDGLRDSPINDNQMSKDGWLMSGFAAMN
jgi:hypothetical protein